MQFLIPPQHRTAAGVYAIRSEVDKRLYVGSTQNLGARFTSHKSQLRRDVHPATDLQLLVNQHGLEVLRFELIEHAMLGTNLGILEDKWIKKTKAAQPKFGFNSSSKASPRVAQQEKQRLIVDLVPELFEKAESLAEYKSLNVRDLVRVVLADAVSIDNRLFEQVAVARGNIGVSALIRLLVTDEARRLGIVK